MGDYTVTNPFYCHIGQKMMTKILDYTATLPHHCNRLGKYMDKKLQFIDMLGNRVDI